MQDLRILVLDVHKAQRTDRILDAFRKAQTTPVIVPPGCTSLIQPLDVAINKPFKRSAFPKGSTKRNLLTTIEEKCPPLWTALQNLKDLDGLFGSLDGVIGKFEALSPFQAFQYEMANYVNAVYTF